MNKKKYIIAIILFLFIGFTIFSFASPKDEEKEEDIKKPEIKEEEDKDKDKDKDNTEDNKDNEPVIVKPVADNSYELALNAITKLNELINNGKNASYAYNNASNLVSKVKDQNKKNALALELKRAKDTMDIVSLVNELASKVESASNAKDVESAREFNKENEIGDKVSNIHESFSSVKDELNNLLDSLSKILDDTAAPSLNVNDNDYFNEDVELTISDENEVVITITKNGGEPTVIENNSILTEGEYEITVVDRAYNEITVKITIDKTSPIATTNYSTIDKTNENVVVTIIANEELKELDGWTLSLDKKELSKEFSENETNIVVIEDLAGNKTNVAYSISNIDKVLPEVVEVNQKFNSTTNMVDVTIKFSEEVTTKNNENIEVTGNEVTLHYSESKTETIEFTDLAGNKNTYELVVNYEAPVNTVRIFNKADLIKFRDEINNGSLAYQNKVIEILNDIDLDGEEWTPINAKKGELRGSVIDGKNSTIKNMKVNTTGEQSAAFISYSGGITIKNLTFDGAIVTQDNANQRYAGVVLGKVYGPTYITNVHVKNSHVTNNWQAGGIVGFGESTTIVFTDSSVTDSVIGGANATAGTLFGLGVCDVTVTNSSAKNVKLYTDSLTWISSKAIYNNYYTGYIYGKKLTVTGSTEENISIAVHTPKELAGAISSPYLDNTIIDIEEDLNMTGITWKANKDVNLVVRGNNHTIERITYETNGDASIFLTHLGAGKSATFTDIIIENTKLISKSTGQNATGIFVGMADAAKDITIENCKVRYSNIENTSGWTGGFVGYTAGYNVVNNGPVYTTVTITNSDFSNNIITGTGSVGGFVGHAGGNPDTTTKMKNVLVLDNTINGENTKKTGLIVGTAHVGITIIDDYTIYGNTILGSSSNNLYGRFVPGETGKLTINGENK